MRKCCFTSVRSVVSVCESVSVSSPFISVQRFQSCRWSNTRRWTSAGLMLGQRRKWWARIGPALGEHLVFAGSVDRLHCVSHIAGCGYIKTVAQLIESKDDSITVDIKNGFHHIKIHLYCPKEPFNNIISYQPLWLCCWRRDIFSFLFIIL